MKKWIMLCKLQIKASCNSLPRIIAGTIGLTFLVFLIFVFGTKLMEHDDKKEKMTIAVVSEGKESRYIEEAFGYMRHIDNINELCEFVMTDHQNALEQLENGTVASVINIPSNFISNIMKGKNTEAEIIFPKMGVNNTSVLFREVITAAALDLSTAQAGIYAVYDAGDFLDLSHQEQKIAEKDMNAIYIAYVISRGTHFVIEDIASLKTINMGQFYISTGILILLIMSGIICVELLKKDNNAMSVALKREGIHSGMLGFAKILGVSIVFFVLGAVVFTLTMFATIRYPEIRQILSGVGLVQLVTGYIGIFVVLFSVFSYVYCIYRIASHPVYGVIILFVTSMFMMYLSGCFIPSALLPELARSVGKILPTTWFFNLITQIITGTVSFMSIVYNFIYITIFIAIAAMQERWSR